MTRIPGKRSPQEQSWKHSDAIAKAERIAQERRAMPRMERHRAMLRATLEHHHVTLACYKPGLDGKPVSYGLMNAQECGVGREYGRVLKELEGMIDKLGGEG